MHKTSNRDHSTKEVSIPLRLVKPVLQGSASRWAARQRQLVKSKGVEWTVVRAKAVYNIALLLRSGEYAKATEVARNNRIALSKSGFPRGLEGMTVRAFVEARKPSVIRRTSALLRWYTAIYGTEPTESQLSKSRASINNPGKVIEFAKPDQKGWLWFTQPLITHLRQQVTQFGTRRLPSLDALSGASSYPRSVKFKPTEIKDWNPRHVTRQTAKRLTMPFTHMVGSLLTKGNVPQSLLQTFGDHPLRNFASHFSDISGDDTFGNITVIQEGGLKGRVVCSPNAWVALYTTWHKKVLSSCVKGLENEHRDLLNGVSSVFDQTRGAYCVLERMDAGLPVFCVDQSSATDRFPLILQQKLLVEIGLKDLSLALDELKGPYTSPEGKWTYNAGQPMGLPPSFMLYHLSHLLLVEGIIADLGLPKGIYYCILGDDIVIFHEEIAKQYRLRLGWIGVDVSEHKSFSGDLAEFAGFIFTETGSGNKHAFRPYKHPRQFKKNHHLNLAHAYGSSILDWSGKDWKEIFIAYQATQGQRALDLSPLVGNTQTSVGRPCSVTPDYLLSISNRIAWRETKITSEFPMDVSSYLSGKLPGWFDSLVQNKEPNSFDPYIYLQHEIRRKLDWRSHFEL